MTRAERDSIRLLKGALVAAVALPLALFAYACWLDYKNVEAYVDNQISRTTDVINEHALKVLESVQRATAEINEGIRDMPDEVISSNQAELHAKLGRIAEGAAQIKSLWIFAADGRALVNSLSYPVDATNFKDRDYFAAHVEKDIGTYVGRVLRPRPPYGGAPFFGVSTRRISPDGSFRGVIQASVLPEYFEGFYQKLAREPGEYASIVREDGVILARYPSLDREAKLAENGPLYQSMIKNPQGGRVTLVSAIDGVSRTVSYRKLPEFPVFVLAGMETSAIQSRWLAQIVTQLAFGLPATAALIFIIALAIRRTRRLYSEAQGRQDAELALKKAQRLEAIGQLTGGVAHDVNNLLMVIGGSVDRVKSRVSDPQLSRSLAMIEAAVQKGAALTRQLLSFSRGQSLSPKVIDVVACISDLRDVLHQSLRGDIRIIFDLPDEVLPVRVDRNELEIALLNLTVNARDAMPDGGLIRIVVRGVALPKESSPSGLAGDYVTISVTDSGQGIAKEIRDHVFEPYFTTKKLDRGTGLGLSQVYGFAKQSNGDVSFETEAGLGTVFTIVLPRSREPIEEEKAPPQNQGAHGALRVLLVEDNPEVRVVASDYLEALGYSVVTAESGERAVDLLNGSSEIDVVFSDIVLPGLSGVELARIIREHHSEVGVVLATGYSEKTAAAVAEGFTLLQKPYTRENLRTALSQVVRGRNGRAA